ncbi:cytochrome c6 PetJ [Thalassoporum mexicanum]|uniref:cytochrome c6 PetJ n=1 Tax=Thalassoporum mexicanum TaxID=3457544 RepID=UPI001CED79BC|nr:c-type cytochrome [Pseudanabaena sp. PCC 7367]
MLICLFTCSIVFVQPSYAADAANGAKLFSVNCASCHAKGRNLVIKNKTLQKDALETYGMYSIEKIVYQIGHGKNAMPAFRKLSDQQMEDIATYVLQQADNGWS